MVFEQIREIIAEQLNIPQERITPDTSLLTDIGADSLDIFQIVSDLEDAFGVEFSSSIVEEMKTVADAVKYIENNR